MHGAAPYLSVADPDKHSNTHWKSQFLTAGWSMYVGWATVHQIPLAKCRKLMPPSMRADHCSKNSIVLLSGLANGARLARIFLDPSSMTAPFSHAYDHGP